MSALTVPVPCLNGHHDSHTVTLRPALGIDGGILAEQALFESKGDRQLLTRLWLPIFVRYGAVDWDVCDESGAAAPFDVEALMADYRLSRPVADKAAEVYKDAVLAPFRASPAKRSPTGPTRATTSRRSQRITSPSV